MKLAIFDIDGTLTNTNNVDEECFVTAFAEAHAISRINTNWGAYPHTTDSGITLHIFQEKFGRHPEETELAEVKRCFVKLLNERYRFDSSSFAEIADASVVLDRLSREPEWAVAIATGCWRESALLKLEAAKIDVGSIPAAYAEDGLSREEILAAALSKSLEHYQESGFEKIVSIGDGLWDVHTARRLSYGFLGIGSGESALLLRQAGAKHVIEDFADYDQLIKFLAEAQIPALEYLG
jgi:phosphoglycolate phosphatase-like HAD superfamily hydrolase